MSCIGKFASVDIDVRYDGHSDHVGLRFHDQAAPANYVEVVFNRFNLPTLFEGILEATRTERPTAIQQEHLDGLVLFEGHSVHRLPDGNVELKMVLRTDDGVRSVPWTMSAAAARDLAEDLIRFSS